ncbi:MAG TPA: nuclear transport factor 2 family protein [Pseudosphingobacterium sp.]|nr:nuclear transport factor 2 family protein [Pseudosphingobacterium sp.]
MIRTKTFIAFLGVFINMNVIYTFGQSNLNATPNTLEYLKKFRSNYSKGMLNGKPEAIQAYYAESIRLMPEFQKTVIGKSNIISYHKAFLIRFDIQELNREEIEILDLGPKIVELGTFTMRMTLKNNGEKCELKGKYMNIWEKLEGNKLSLTAEAWNYSHHTDIANHLIFEEVPVVNVALQAHVPINNNISFELAALNRLMEETIIQHDAKIWSQFYTDDGMFIYSNSPIYKGRKALDEFLQKHVNELPVFEKLDIRNDYIQDFGDYVIEYASHIANWRNGNSSGVSTGKDIRIWRRDKDCSLKIFREMAMYD